MGTFRAELYFTLLDKHGTLETRSNVLVFQADGVKL